MKGLLVHAQTLDDVVRPYRHYPATIQTALLRLETHPTFRSVTRSALKVLKALVTRACATNGTTLIRARLETVAMQADVSTKTVQRALSIFDQFGWVKAASSGRSEYGVFTSRRYVFSAEFCALAHLPTAAKPAADLARETEMSDGAVYADLSLKKDLREISIKNRKDNPEANPITLPEPLRAMPEETAIKDTGVCKLIGISNRLGHKLQDVYAVAKPHLVAKGATKGRAYRYLLAMLLNPKPADYAGRAAQMQRQAADGAAAAAIRSTAERARYKRYRAPNGALVRIFDGTAEVTRDGQSAMLGGAQMLALYADIESGKLQEIVQ